MNQLNSFFASRKLLIAAFVLSYVHWVYLFFAVRMEIILDALGWEFLANTIYKEGWTEFLVTGPHREPFYPFMISLSMRIADCISVSYQSIQTIVQVFILLFTQFMVYKLLARLKIRNFITALAVLYVGFSPVLVNSTFTLYCEIITCPFVLGAVFVSARSWKTLTGDEKYKDIFLLGMSLSVLFLILAFTRAVFLCVFPILLSPFIVLAIVSLFKKRKEMFCKSSVFLLTSVLFFYLPVMSYKSANKKYNGQYAFTTRGSWALYGNTARRMDIMYPKRILAGIATATGKGTCHYFFGEYECEFWEPLLSDYFGKLKEEQLRGEGLSPDEINSALVHLSKSP